MYRYFFRIRHRADRVNTYLLNYTIGIDKGVRNASPQCHAKISGLYWELISSDPVSNKELRRICREVIRASSLEHLADRYIVKGEEDKPVQRLNKVFECYDVTEPDENE